MTNTDDMTNAKLPKAVPTEKAEVAEYVKANSWRAMCAALGYENIREIGDKGDDDGMLAYSLEHALHALEALHIASSFLEDAVKERAGNDPLAVLKALSALAKGRSNPEGSVS